ncbi:MAG TPA: class II aldolase/adducin family protein [Clostridia bacterium]|nr:class II aldolase/adducin family protein [Clostridia bacterium]
MNEQECKNSVLNAAKKLLSENLVARTWGNVSCKCEDGKIIITPSGLSYEKMTVADLVLFDPITKKSNGKHKPSSEKGIHAAAFEIFPDAEFVIHTHQIYASALSLYGIENIKLSAEEKALLGDIGIAEYGLPGTKKLTKNVKKCFENGSKIVLIEKHGAVVVGKNADDAFAKADMLEKICKKSCMAKVENIKIDNEKADSTKNSLTEQEDFSIVLQDPEILTTANYAKNYLYAQLDDVAQLAGRKIPVVDNADKKFFKKHNVVIIKNVGAVVKAKTQDELEALCLIIKKACICYLHTLKSDKNIYLPAFEANLMRFVYKTKYSKQYDTVSKEARKKEIVRVIKFVLFSASAGIIQVASFTLLNEVIFKGNYYWISYLVALVLSVVWNFTFNRRFTFKSANNVPIAMLKVLGYYAVFTPLSTLFVNFLTQTALWNEYLVLVINMLINFVTEFLFDQFVVFRKSIDTNDIAMKEKAKKEAETIEENTATQD